MICPVCKGLLEAGRAHNCERQTDRAFRREHQLSARQFRKVRKRAYRDRKHVKH